MKGREEKVCVLLVWWVLWLVFLKFSFPPIIKEGNKHQKLLRNGGKEKQTFQQSGNGICSQTLPSDGWFHSHGSSGRGTRTVPLLRLSHRPFMPPHLLQQMLLSENSYGHQCL